MQASANACRNVDFLFLHGAGAIDGTGNSSTNYIQGNESDNILNGRGGTDALVGGTGNDTFVFQPGEANGDYVYDFSGNGAGVGDQLQFSGYGVGATFTQNDATHWQVNYNGGASHDIITFVNAPAIDPTDLLFV